jgi:hypothetical protein
MPQDGWAVRVAAATNERLAVKIKRDTLRIIHSRHSHEKGKLNRYFVRMIEMSLSS